MIEEEGPLYRVLNVNADEHVRRQKTITLKAAGFEVGEADSAAAALRQAVEQQPDLILLDVDLPDRSGLDVCSELQPELQSADTFEGDRHYAIVLISPQVTRPEDIARGMAAGADAYLVEPLDDTFLVGTVYAVAERHARRRWVAAEREALRKRDFRYRILAATVGDTIYDWDLTTDVIDWSDAVYRMLRYRPGLVGRTSQWWVDHIHPDDRGRVMSAVHRNFAEQNPTLEIEYRFARSDGSYAIVVDRSSILYEDGGRPLRAIGAMADITERRQLADQLRLAQKMEAVGLLAGGIAHDFNNVLTSVLGFSGLLKQEVEDRPRALEHATEIQVSAKRAAHLIGQLLAFSRRQVMKSEVLNLNEVIDESTRMLHRLIGAHIRVETAFTDPLPTVRVDRTQLEQVLVNLVVNARDAMPEGGTITVSTALLDVGREGEGGQAMPRGRYVRLSVSDTGEGMDEETRARIFEPFFTTKGRGRGTGLGLATVYGIVKQSGGYIWVTSTPGAGTTFDIYLPALDLPADAPSAPEEAVPGELNGWETILVVEDEDSVRRLSYQVLTRAGYRVLQAPDGPTALALADQFGGTIHLLLSDVVLPGLSGIVVAETLRPLRPDMRVLFMSGYSSETHGYDANQGARPLLPKPFSSDTLLREVRRILAGAPDPSVS